MRVSKKMAAWAMAALAVVIVACSGSTAEAANGYIALLPDVLRSGEHESVSLTLFDGEKLAKGTVEVALLKEGREVLKETSKIDGKGAIEFDVPRLEKGDYELKVRGDHFEDGAKVRVEDGSLLFLETDKPIYKPGQPIQIRVISLNSELKPQSLDNVSVEVQDAKGTKVYRAVVSTDDYGMATLDMPLSEEPNLGVWKLTASAGDRSSQIDVRVEEYVLPKYEVTVDLQKEWFLANEKIAGTISAEYSYGKPVKGELKISARRYVGQWEEFASFTKEIDGEVDFELPAVQYVAGVPQERGMGNVTLDISVTERATGYEEKTSRLLTVSQSSLSVQLIPEGSAFKPGLPFTFLVITETPDNQPQDADVTLEVTYTSKDFEMIGSDRREVATQNGKALLEITPPEGAVSLMVNGNAGDAYTYVALDAAYSPSRNFIQLEQRSEGDIQVGDTVTFNVNSTKEAGSFYYEVVSRGRLVFTGHSDSNEIEFKTTPLMAPSAKLLVYQILPNSEVAADYMPFDVKGDYPQSVEASFSAEQVEPGQSLELALQTEGQAKVGLAVVDRSVFILAENRLNLQQVFDELERLYMQPQAELDEVELWGNVQTQGAKDTFKEAGLIVLSNKKVPEGEKYEREGGFFAQPMAGAVVAPATGPGPQEKSNQTGGSGLAEVERIRQYFPETWVWSDLVTDADGRASLPLEAPDSITTWVLRAVAISKEKGLGIAESELKVLQPFFIQVDLPYSTIRGEEFPVKVALYNYQDTAQDFVVEMEAADWFQPLGETSATVTVQPNDVGAAQFMISPRQLGSQKIKVTARSTDAADAVVKEMIVAPEGVEREAVQNNVLAAGNGATFESLLPTQVVDGSARAYLTLTASYLTQTIDGLDSLLQMPYGCGEQNMLLLAPDIFVAKYLKETGQTKPEVMAKAEKLMITGYQRELTYRRGDGSFSAFGDNDSTGSLWLSAFVLKTFSQAKGLIFVDEGVLDQATQWIVAQQEGDGSFESVGFVHHEDMMGGVQGKTALTAYVATALLEAGETEAAEKAVRYLEGELDGIDDSYTMALTTYALELAQSGSAGVAHDALMEMAVEDESGLHWGSEIVPLPEPQGGEAPARDMVAPMPGVSIERSTVIEATAYATLALTKHGDAFNAGQAARWLVGKRNSLGGYGSTQDTVVALQALTEQAAGAARDVDLRLTVNSGSEPKVITINAENYDVLQVLEVPAGASVQVQAEGSGEVVLQHVTRFNVPQEEAANEVFKIDVSYGTGEVQVNDTISIDAHVQFNPPEPMKAGMVVVDIAVPTGFDAIKESIEAAVAAQPKIKRFDVSGRKVIFYIEDMEPGETVSFGFEAKALYPVKAKGAASQAYSYYRPEWRGEALSPDLSVSVAQ